MEPGIQEQLNALGGCCDEWKQVEVTVTYQITKRERVCVPLTYLDPAAHQAIEIEGKLNQVTFRPDLTGEITLVKRSWNYI